MTEHTLKCWPKEFAAVRAGTKLFDFRKNDRDFQAGDTLLLREYNPNAEHHTGEQERRLVTYVLRDGFGLPEGYAVLSLAPPKVNVTVKTEGIWQWWAGADEEWCTVGPEDSREAIIQAATNDSLGEFQDEEGRWKLGFHIVEARQDPLRMADWIEADDLLNRAEDGVADSDRVTSEYDDGPYFECTPAQNKDLRERIERACDEWQAAHGLVFPCRTFSHTRKNEHVFVDHPSPGTTTEGSD